MSAMINLLPDIRQAKLVEKRRRQIMSGVAIATWLGCGAIVLALSLATAAEKVLISAATKDAKNKTEQLRNVPGIIDALTAQQHLASLPTLYSQRVYMTKFFQALIEADPSDMTMSSLSIDGLNQLTVTGGARTYSSVAKLARALSLANISIGPGASPTNNPYFTNVNITEATKSSLQGVTFTIQATMQPGVTNAGI
jgi:Tfp pilus assembly protein PilN